MYEKINSEEKVGTKRYRVWMFERINCVIKIIIKYEIHKSVH